MAVPSVTTDAFARHCADPDHAVLDVRPMAAYNGWTLRDEPRGGHVPDATHIPLQWTQYMDWVEVVEEKNLNSEQPITVYGYDADESQAMAEKLGRLGFEDVNVYEAFIDEWSADPERPLRRLERYDKLVHPAWLRARLGGLNGTPDEMPGRMDGVAENGRPTRDLVLCHAHFDHRADYEKGHIPGAVPLNTNWLESTDTWNRRSPGELEEALRRLGIRRDTTVVLYGRFAYPTYEQEHPAQSAGHLGAMRCAAILLYAGVEDVRVLNGGVTAWETAGYALSTDNVAPQPVDRTGLDIPERPEYMIDMPEAKELLAAADGDLVSVRSWSEFIGERSGYHYMEQTGRIPGAVFGNCGSDAYHMENYRNFDYTTRAFEEIAQKWAEAGITPDRRIAFYCGTGWRGSEAFMNAYWMGWPNIAVYDGGWYEWGCNSDEPTATGEPEATPKVA
jgi:thiosulfate/3-mercaptopyruvate sulfurtransferase